MSSKTTNKGVAWLYNEVCALLDIWADQEIQQQLAGRLHNMCIYEKISKRLSNLGIYRTGEQCREKIKKLRRDYKTVVDNNYSPAFARKMLGCYDKVHEIFGNCTVVKPFMIESIIYNENISKRSVETDESDSQNIKDFSVSEYEQPKHTINESKVNTDSSDTSHIDTIGEKKVKANLLCSTSITGIKKDQRNFRNAIETMGIKHSEQKTEWNIFKSRMERSLEKRKFLHRKILKRQAMLHNRFIQLERKKLFDEVEQEHQRLYMLEIERQKHNEQEINLFKSLLCRTAEKPGVKLSFKCEYVV